MMKPTTQESFHQTVSRRRWLTSHAAAGLAVATAPYFVPAEILGGPGRPGPNDQIQLGVVGCGVRGKYLIANMPTAGRVVSLCDCAQQNIDETIRPGGVFAEPLADFALRDAGSCSIYRDYREMIAHEKLDAVIVSTPDHHHCLVAILACLNGMDVYVEKPLSLTIAEGRALVDAARKSERVVQVGSQQRTMQVNRFACEFIRSGGLGEISLVQLRNFPGPMPIQDYGVEEIPSGMEWDLFCGPTALQPYNKMLWLKDAFKYGYLTWRGWDLFRDYSGHLMTNWGGHSVDMVQYALGMDQSGPIECWPEKDLLSPTIDDHWHDKTPPLTSVADDAQDKMRFCPISMRYANGTIVKFDPEVEKTVFHGSKGTLELSRNQYQVTPRDLAAPMDAREQAKWNGTGHVARPHIENWLDAVRSRTIPNAPVEAGHRTATVCHLANLTRQLRRRVKWDPVNEQFVNDSEADRLRSRTRRAGFELPDV